MQISFNWLKEYLENLPEPQKLGEILNSKSFEVESVEKRDDDYIFSIDVLPNRSHDCLCHCGVAVEIATVVDGTKLKQNNFYFADNLDASSKKNITQKSDFSVDVKADFCRRYLIREIKNIKVSESPVELKNKLKSIGQKSINNIVDITNIVMFEIGQPMHAFDSNKLVGKSIFVRQAQDGEKITTLDNQEVSLTQQDHVIADGFGPLAIAGVKGGNRAGVDSKTTNIVLESANFLPSLVRKTSKRVNISTESSKRFENEITPEICQDAMELATHLILKYASSQNTEVSDLIDFYPYKWPLYKTGISPNFLKKILGINIPLEDIKKTLELLGFKYEIVKPRDMIVNEAQKHIGTPYKYGASVRRDSPNYFDCSSFTAYIYYNFGIQIPRMSIEQFVFGQEISKEELLPGDLVFCNTGDLKNAIHFKTKEFLPETEIKTGIDHVGIYLGDDKIIHSSSHNKNGVEIAKLSEHVDFVKSPKYCRVIFDENYFVVTVPKYRLDIGSISGIDIKSPTELAEEIARVYGYEKINDQKIQLPNFIPKKNSIYYINYLIRKLLSEDGFDEVMTYSFVENGEISPEKPISEDKRFLRNNLLNSLENSLQKNIKNADLLGVDIVKIFEISKIFSKKGEFSRLAIGVLNKNGIKKPKEIETLELAISKLKQNFGNDLEIIYNKDKNIAEINLESLYQNNLTNFEYIPLEKIDVVYKPFSVYPFVIRDIAVWLPKDIPQKKLIDIIKNNSTEFLVNLRLFDQYQKEDKISYAYRLVFQSDQKTLNDVFVNEIMDNIYKDIKSAGFEVR
ncbi:MAG TPA: phenylalanine--tRNA ligase beta subunit-related protein [Candidatus Paceibacterota bacterium]|nr:phenylalanine--tRNA ligase beta subunit-related protein [Candidatus Paceibacterota bacterium]HMP19063.1 phenylalanine--tRNA ligase beta subunit-related protein [Candidatus Paceibacterota bacterium]HMP85519.1 phenylalanine--tRNA ligase beta subunit-related protein [Candidatus Paceibacterota bacterium]